jgi:hypothetical protein
MPINEATFSRLLIVPQRDIIEHMVLQIDIPPQVEERLRRQAEAAGTDMWAYVSRLLEQAADRRSLEVELASVRKQFAQTGINDDELIQDITDAQTEYRSEVDKKTT